MRNLFLYCLNLLRGRGRRAWLGSAVFAGFLALLLSACGEQAKPAGKKALIIAIDGMDPRLLTEFVQKGVMPHFKKLMLEGDFKPLGTSTPPQSPVAWSNFITGANPGVHGIYDFIHRHPENYFPYLSTSEIKDPPEEASIVVGHRVIWWKGGEAKLLRRGKPFWEYLAERGIYTRVFKIPSNFPPYEGKGWSGSGMGTPDILGTYGTFTFFTDNPPDHPEAIGGGTITPVYPVNNRIETEIVGPKNIFALDPNQPYLDANHEIRNYPDSSVPITIYLDPEHPSAKIEFQDQELLLSEGEWSGWVPIKFEMWPPFVTVHGIVRFYLKEVRPDFKLYASPVNMDPFNPTVPVTNPPEYAKQVAEANGYYYTQGMPEDTKARQADLDIFNDEELLHQMLIVHDEDLKMFKWHLDQWKEGLLYYYFSTLDLGTHMFWRLHDKKHPAYDPEWAKKLGDPLELIYRKMDHVLEMALPYVDENTILIIMSDHGFGPWYRSFQVNTWLLENGYIKLKPGVDPKDVEYFRDKRTMEFAVDWSRTLAYGLGINGLYINLMGREEYGAVSPMEYNSLVEELLQKLSEYVDPETGEKPILDAVASRKVYHGDALDIAPDIILGFKRGYRGGDESALGKFPEKVITINKSPWSGDHCIAASEVPGVILSNKTIKKPDPELLDLGPTILSIYGIPAPETMDGKPVF